MPPEGEHRYRGSVLDVCRDFIEAVDTSTKKDEKKKTTTTICLRIIATTLLHVCFH